MEVIHRIIDGKILNQVISLPKPMQEILVEIIVKPAKAQSRPILNRNELRAQLRGSHTEALSGVIPTNDYKTLEELRAERQINMTEF